MDIQAAYELEARFHVVSVETEVDHSDQYELEYAQMKSEKWGLSENDEEIKSEEKRS